MNKGNEIYWESVSNLVFVSVQIYSNDNDV